LQHIGRETTPDGGKNKDRNANGKDAPSSKVIAERPSDQDQSREKERIGLHDPLDIRVRRVQVALDNWQRDNDDRAIDKGHA
jgi:hypothetical protein